MSPHPVNLHVTATEPRARVHVVIRLVLLTALGALGCSSVYWLLFLLLPAGAALLIAQKGGARYLADDAPRIVRVLGWLAAAYAYLWLLTDRFDPDAPAVQLSIELGGDASGEPTTTSALLRLLYSLPALVLLALISIPAGVLWLVGALWILFVRRVPNFISDYLGLVLTYQFRLVAYHLSLVDRYPAFATPMITHPAT